jgi:molybdopterin converting factor small subunit
LEVDLSARVVSLLNWEMCDNVVKLIVKFMSIPRQRTGTGRVEFVSSDDTLRNVLREITESYRIADVIFTESGEVRPYARILINGRSFQFLGGMDAELHDGDTVALIYPWLGHEDF